MYHAGRFMLMPNPLTVLECQSIHEEHSRKSSSMTGLPLSKNMKKPSTLPARHSFHSRSLANLLLLIVDIVDLHVVLGPTLGGSAELHGHDL